MISILICYGTRPEYIKVKSLIDNLNNVKTCFTGQHRDLVKSVNFDYELTIDNECENRLNSIFISTMKHSEIFEDIEK
jgi:UDP-N-acetylglucosamine 2-epimerase